MAYDYTKDFLYRHSEVVGLVRRAYYEDLLMKKAFGDDPAQLARERHLISNVMRSLAVNYPDEYLPIRKTLRTWVTRENGSWYLHFGRPTVSMPGRLPGGSTATTGWLTAQTSERSFSTDTYEHDRRIDSMDEFQRLVGRVIETPPNIKVVLAEFADTFEDLSFFQSTFEGWTVEAIGPTTLKLTRQ